MNDTNWEERFDQKVNEVGHGADFTNGKDGKVSEFGYKTLRDDEIFTVTDFGNIKKFIATEISKARAEALLESAELVSMCSTTTDNLESHDALVYAKNRILALSNQSNEK